MSRAEQSNERKRILEEPTAQLVVDRFKQALLARENPRIEEFQPTMMLDAPRGQPETAVSPRDAADTVALGAKGKLVLLEELLHLEIEFRIQRGESVSLDEYLLRFPDLAQNADCVVRLSESVRNSSAAVPRGEPADTQVKAGPEPDDPRVKAAVDVPTLPRTDPPIAVKKTSTQASPRGPKQFGDYELLQEIARGGMGVVYKARQMKLNRFVALKMILGGKLAGSQEVQRFYLEAEAAAKLDHPGIVPIFEIGEQDGQHFFSMGYVEGCSLVQRVAEGPLPPRDAARLVLQVAQAVQYAHERGVIHRDLKPGNILLDQQGKPHVTDFGLAKLADGGSDLTGTGQILGTPSYMPPEQASGKIDQIAPQADVYALGAILYCLLTGRPPFQTDNPMDTLKLVLEQEPVSPRELIPSIPVDLETISLKCLEKETGRRYATAADVAAELRRYLDDEPIAARPISTTAKAWRWCRRNPLVARLIFSLVTAGITLLLVISVALVLVLAQKKKADLAKSDAIIQKDLAVEAEREAVEQKKTADAQKKVAVAAKTEADDQRRVAEFSLARLNIATGTQAQDRGEPFTALHWYARAWANDRDPANESWHRARIGSTLVGVPALVGVCFHDAPVDDVAINPAGTRIVTCTRDSTAVRGSSVYVWDFAASTLAFGPLKHLGPVSHMGFSPDGATVITASEDTTAVLWDAATGKQVLSLPHPDPVTAAQFSPNGAFIATGAGKHVRLWSTANGSPTGVILEHSGEILAVEFAREADRLLVAGRDGSARVWDFMSGGPVGPNISWTRVVRNNSERYYKRRPTLSPNGKLVLATDDKVKLVEADTGAVMWQHAGAPTLGAYLEWSADGRRVLTSEHLCLHIRDVDSGRPLISCNNPREPNYASLSKDGQTVTCAVTGGGVTIWDANNGASKSPILRCASSVTRMQQSADGRYLIGSSQDGTARVWDLSALRGVDFDQYKFTCGRAHIPEFENARSSAPDGQTQFHAVGSEGDLKQPNGTKLLAHPAPVTASRFSADGTRLATFSDGSVRVWNVASGSQVCPPLALPAGFVPLRLEMSSDGSRVAAIIGPVATGGIVEEMGDRFPSAKAIVWDVDNHREIFTLPSRLDSSPLAFGVKSMDGVVNDARLTPDGQHLVAGVESSGELFVFEIASGRRLYRKAAFRGYLNKLGLGATGRTVLIIGGNLMAREFDLLTGEHVGPPLHFSSNPKEILAPSPDGRQVAVITQGNGLRIWDLKTGDALTTLNLSVPCDFPCWFNVDGTTFQFRSGSEYRSLVVPRFTGPAECVQASIRVITGRVLDETGGIDDIDPDEFIRNRHSYCAAWQSWQGVPVNSTAQP